MKKTDENYIIHQALIVYLNVDPETEALHDQIRGQQERIHLIAKDLKGELDTYEQDSVILENIRDDKKEMLQDALFRIRYYRKADRYISSFLSTCSWRMDWEAIFFVESPFNMLCLQSDNEDLELYFTSDSVIEVRGHETLTHLFR